MIPLIDIPLRYWRTARHLRTRQLYGLARVALLKRLPRGPTTVQGVTAHDKLQPSRTSFLLPAETLRGTEFTFLNHAVSLTPDRRWQADDQVKLWRYHLHYMSYLRQRDMTPRARREWMHSWIQGNPDPYGEGWEPFPTSLRLVNWFKVWWEDGFLKEDGSILESAYAQARHLRRFVEYHVDVNHLLENLKTLLWAGCVFEGREAETWKSWAARGLVGELTEQILADGGHYERSPMYHALVLEGLLDLLNVRSAWETECPELARLLVDKAQGMLTWLATMSHPDGEIALFNDAAFKVAPRPAVLFDYACKLGLTWRLPARFENLSESGYVVCRDEPHYLVMDVGPLGPDYQPGHAHCDLLSFEWSVGERRVICDSGVYAYQDPLMRSYVRSTAAHNTLRIDGAEQSEIWKTFRIARRAHPLDVRCHKDADGGLSLQARHDGYHRLAGRPGHERRFDYAHGKLSVVDRVVGNGRHDVEAFIHFHPQVVLDPVASREVDVRVEGCRIGRLITENWSEMRLDQGWYCPEFGKREAATVLTLVQSGPLPFEGRVEIHLAE